MSIYVARPVCRAYVYIMTTTQTTRWFRTFQLVVGSANPDYPRCGAIPIFVGPQFDQTYVFASREALEVAMREDRAFSKPRPALADWYVIEERVEDEFVFGGGYDDAIARGFVEVRAPEMAE